MLCAAAAAAIQLALPPAATAAATYRIDGRGFGHGIGMSQWGAFGFAKRGSTYKQILVHYYSGTKIEQAPADTRTTRVLVKTARQITFSSVQSASGKKIDPDRKYRINRSSKGLVLRTTTGKRVKTFKGTVKLTGPRHKVVAGRSLSGAKNARYRGYLKLIPKGTKSIHVVNVVGLEKYLQGVVPAEVLSSWPQNALRAQAITARSYALATRKKGGDFDQYADIRSQVYRGVTAETVATNKAVVATKGEIVTHNGKVATTYFFSTSGGKTENIEHAWPGSKAVPYLKGVDDPYDSESPRHRWGPITFSRGSLAKKFKGNVKGSFRGIKVVERGPSGRAVKVKLFGSKGSMTVSGPDVRKALGLRSSWFYIKKIDT